MEHAATAPHGESHASHGASHYVKVWAVLLVLLVVSICGPMLGIRALTIITAFGIAIVKAVMVAREFMHLKFEKMILSYILLTFLILMAIFFYGIAPDVMKDSGQNWVKNAVIQQAPAAAQESGEGSEHAEH